MEYDIAITGGQVVDGTGQPAFAADIMIANGRIAAVGRFQGTAKTVIDATGKTVSPGFIDIHTHYDAQMLWDSRLSFSPWHGVTTCVVGNCGFGIAPTRESDRDMVMRTLEKVEGMSFDALREGLGAWGFETFPQYLDTVDQRKKLINVGVLLGHTPLRVYAMGQRAIEAPANENEIAAMAKIVDEAMDAGAFGFSTSQSPVHVGYRGLPVPSRFAAFDEIKALAAATKGRGITQITVGSYPSFSDFADLAAASGGNVTWTAILAGMSGVDGHTRFLEEAKALQAKGVRLIPQVACRPLVTEFQFSAPFSFERTSAFKPVAAAEDNDARMKLYKDPEFRQAFRTSMDRDAPADKETVRLRPSFYRIVIADASSRPELQEVRLVDAAAKLKMNPCDLALDLAIESDLAARFRMPLFNDDDDEVEILLKSPNVLLGLSDAGAHVSQMYDTSYATHLLSYWVRERKAFSLEYAIWMLTGRPAEVFGVSGRGRLAAGLAADVVIFDADKIQSGKPERVYDLPAGADRLITRPSGIDAVIVNGTIIRRDGREMLSDADPFPGKLLRRGHAAH